MKGESPLRHGLLALTLVPGFGLLGACAQWLPVSEGVYRLPYADGTTVAFSNDHTSHPASLNRIDLRGQGGGPFTVVAAGAGWIQIIVENNDTFCPNIANGNPSNDTNGDGVTTTQEDQNAACSSYSGPSSFCCERHIEGLGGACPSGGTCLATVANPTAPNNLVWIQHPNGEWTKYTHMQRGSVGTGTDNNGNPGAGRFVGKFVNAGEPLGLEGDVGNAGGPHVHFEVAVPNYVDTGPGNPPADVDNWFTADGFVVDDGVVDDVDGDTTDDLNRQNRIPVFCQLGFAFNNSDDDPSTAGPCDDQCSTDTLQLAGTVTAGNIFYRQVTDTMGNQGSDFVARANSGVSLRAGDRITLSPGFQAETGAYFSAAIGACDSPGGS